LPPAAFRYRHLRNGRLVMLAEDFQRRVLEARFLRAQIRDLSRRSIGFSGEVLLARRIAVEAPGRLAASFADRESGSTPAVRHNSRARSM
jgi:hypothetical protein